VSECNAALVNKQMFFAYLTPVLLLGDQPDEIDHIKEAAILSQERALLPLVEDVTDWLNNTLGL